MTRLNLNCIWVSAIKVWSESILAITSTSTTSNNCLTTMQTGAMQAWKLLFVVSFSSMVFLVCFWYANLSGNDNILVTRLTRPRDRSKYLKNSSRFFHRCFNYCSFIFGLTLAWICMRITLVTTAHYPILFHYNHVFVIIPFKANQ